MSGSRALALPVLMFVLSGCGRPESPAGRAEAQPDPALLTAATIGDQVVLPTGDYLRLPQYGNADAEYGRRLAMQCRACHSFERGGVNLVGPNLHGFFGRPAGSVEGYGYSPVLEQADFIWTPQALDAWLAQPGTFLPGNRMVYAGLGNPVDRDAVVAALLRLTGDDPPASQ